MCAFSVLFFGSCFPRLSEDVDPPTSCWAWRAQLTRPLDTPCIRKNDLTDPGRYGSVLNVVYSGMRPTWVATTRHVTPSYFRGLDTPTDVSMHSGYQSFPTTRNHQKLSFVAPKGLYWFSEKICYGGFSQIRSHFFILPGKFWLFFLIGQVGKQRHF